MALEAIGSRWSVQDVHLSHARGLLHEVRQVRARVDGLVLEFQRVGAWLARALGAADAPDNQPGVARGLATSLHESHRLQAKDRLAADMNELVAWLLLQVVQRLEQLPLHTMEETNGDPDLQDMRACGETLRAASDALQNAARVADAAERFAEDLDQRWHQLRDQVTMVVALSRGNQRVR